MLPRVHSFDVTSGDSGSGTGNPKLPTLTPTTTPTKLVKRKIFGFVHLGKGFGGHGGGENDVVGQSASREVGEDEERKQAHQTRMRDVMHERYAGWVWDVLVLKKEAVVWMNVKGVRLRRGVDVDHCLDC